MLRAFFVTLLIRRPQGPQGCQKMHKNILQINMLSYGFTIQLKVTQNPENLTNDPKMTLILVYTLIRAEPRFDIHITNAHNPSDYETVEFLSRNFLV